MCSRFAEHDIACLVPPLVRDERLLLHCSRLGNLRDMRHYWKSREVTFIILETLRISAILNVSLASAVNTPPQWTMRDKSYHWSEKIPSVSGTPFTTMQCDTATVCQAMDVLCCLQFSCMLQKKKSQYQETISNNMWFNLYTVQSVEIKCKFYHNNTSTTKIFITSI